MKDNIMELKKELSAVHMMLIELQLYLDTHPYDQEAVAKRNMYMKQYLMLKDEYDKYYGMFNADNSYSGDPWEWMNMPWPWEYEANFYIS